MQRSIETDTEWQTDANTVINTLEKLKKYGRAIAENSAIIIHLIDNIEQITPGKPSVAKSVDSLHRNYYPVFMKKDGLKEQTKIKR